MTPRAAAIVGRVEPAKNDGWYRTWLPLEQLARVGHRVRGEVDSVDVAIDQAGRSHVTGRSRTPVAIPGATLAPDAAPEVVIHQDPFQLAHLREWQAWREQGVRLVYSTGDDFLTEPTTATLHRTCVGPVPEPVRRWIGRNDAQRRDMIAMADQVVATTEALATVVRPLNPNVTVISNYLPAEWSSLPPWEHRPGPMTIGYVGGPGHVEDFVQEPGVPVMAAIQASPHVRFYLRGEVPDIYWRSVPAEQRTREEWVHGDAFESHRRLRFDVQVIGLRPSPANASRTALKFHEAALRGIPTIASDYGPYREVIEHGRTGLLARSRADWTTYLDALRDHRFRADLGAAARESVLSWTIEQHGWRWERALGLDQS